jgi:hypothetical protein
VLLKTSTSTILSRPFMRGWERHCARANEPLFYSALAERTPPPSSAASEQVNTVLHGEPSMVIMRGARAMASKSSSFALPLSLTCRSRERGSCFHISWKQDMHARRHGKNWLFYSMITCTSRTVQNLLLVEPQHASRQASHPVRAHCLPSLIPFHEQTKTTRGEHPGL